MKNNNDMTTAELKKYVEEQKAMGEDTTIFASHVGNDMDTQAAVPFWERQEMSPIFSGEMGC